METLTQFDVERHLSAHPTSFDLESSLLPPPPPDPALESYPVPAITATSATCGRSLHAHPYPLLTELLAARTQRAGPRGASEWRALELQRLASLRAVCAAVAAATRADWVGVYAVAPPSEGAAAWGGSAEAPSLQKLAYIGAPSRALFPLTPAFAEGSNNSTVGLSGRAAVVHDTQQLAPDAPYYVCDGKVRSEVCAPIWGEGGELLGIMDCEAFAPRAFSSPEALSVVLGACKQLGEAALLRQAAA